MNRKQLWYENCDSIPLNRNTRCKLCISGKILNRRFPKHSNTLTTHPGFSYLYNSLHRIKNSNCLLLHQHLQQYVLRVGFVLFYSISIIVQKCTECSHKIEQKVSLHQHLLTSPHLECKTAKLISERKVECTNGQLCQCF